MVELIKPNTCQTCVNKVKEEDGSLFCRRMPPQAVPIVGSAVMMKEGKPVVDGAGAPITMVQTKVQSIFPQVRPDWWCREHSKLSLRE